MASERVEMALNKSEQNFLMLGAEMFRANSPTATDEEICEKLKITENELLAMVKRFGERGFLRAAGTDVTFLPSCIDVAYGITQTRKIDWPQRWKALWRQKRSLAWIIFAGESLGPFACLIGGLCGIAGFILGLLGFLKR